MRTLLVLASLVCFMTISAQEPAPTPGPSPTPMPEQALQPVPTPQPEKPKEPRKFQFATGLILLSEGSTAFEDSKITTNSQTTTADVEFTSESAAAIFIEGRLMPKNSAGFQVGLQLEGEREVKDVKVKVNGTTSTGVYLSPRPKISFEILYANAVYKWEGFYVLGGFNYSFPHLKIENQAADESVDVAGALGAQLGVGYQFTSLFGMEFVSQATGVTMTERTSTYNANYGTGYMSDARLQFKFAF